MYGQFDTFLRDLHLHPDLGVHMTFVCENCLHLRQCLHPESAKKSTIPLPNYYGSYYDLRREFEHRYHTSECHNLNSMLESKWIKSKTGYSTLFGDLELNLSPVSENDYSMRQIRHMELIVYQMFNDGKSM